MNKRSYKGIFTPKNLRKYIGDGNKIVFRSLWERQVMNYLDNNAAVISWGSEELVIPYISPLDDKPHRYFPDFIAKIKTAEGKEKILVMEIKPKKQTMLPEGKTMTKKFAKELSTYAVNKAKFEAAEAFCKKNGWEFMVITEDFLKITK